MVAEHTDGKFYTSKDMVKVGCRECAGCWECCTGMGTSVVLDPLDADLLSKGLNQPFSVLLNGPVELHVEDGLILPNLKMQDDVDERCAFLNESGRCSVHGFRPGLCRLFPLGRNYTEQGMNYILLRDACPASGKTKMKVSQWLDREQLKSYEDFNKRWHGIVKAMKEILPGLSEEQQKSVTILFLKHFFLAPYGDTFYEEFDARVIEWRKLGL